MELHLLVLVLILVAAWTAGGIATRIGYPAVLGELLAGILLGPAVLGLLGPDSALQAALGVPDAHHAVEPLADFGILLLMLYIGMEVEPAALRRASWAGFLAAFGGFVVPFAAGVVVVKAFGGTTMAGLFVGIAAGVTSLATKSRILLDLKILDTRIAHVMLAGALLADTLSLVVFAGLIGFHESDRVDAVALLVVAGKAALFFAVTGLIGVFGYPAVVRLLRRLGATHRRTWFMVLVATALAFAELAELAGLHAILGAFIAGLFVRDGMLPPLLQRDVTGLTRDVSTRLLAPIFFVISGFHVSLDVFQTDLGLFLAVMAVAFAGKILGTAAFYVPTGNGWREGLVLGAGMNGRGAVEIILAEIGYVLGLISQEIFSILVFMAIATTATVPLFLKWGTDWLTRRNELVRSADRRRGVLIVGATATARALGRLLGRNQPVWLVDSNPRRVREAQREGLDAVCGNALDATFIADAHAPDAACAVAMTGNVEVNALVARLLRDTFLVPRVSVLVLSPARGADTETFQHIDAKMLFGSPISLTDWDHWFAHGAVDVVRESAAASAAAVPGLDPPPGAEPASADGPSLALAVEHGAGDAVRLVPYHDGDVPGADEALHVARVRSDPHLAVDRFDELVRGCPVLDLAGPLDRDAFFRHAADGLAAVLRDPPAELRAALSDRERMSSTVLTRGLAVPHVEIPGRGRFALVIVRCLGGVDLAAGEPPAEALFVLAGSADERNLHLKALSAIAQIWQSTDFEARWREAADEDDLRALVLRAPRHRG